jgi:hypothetical protein
MPYASIMSMLSESESLKLKVRIAGLETEHRDLDAIIGHLETTSFGDKFALQRLKKRKLHIKDEIEQFSMMLVPDIPA